eukprot:TRINITY_DN4213_c0_g6_i1.p2 TRINITY_DN4213_c0_g6~~TRINITY_DN4213_c0_g6_i1.p2  ORF type:complete len:155 (+),score=32.31 TRINITY_DN4213_c0_g6_i1:106-570(+)
MIRRPPRSPLSSSSAASDVYKRQVGFAPYLWNQSQQPEQVNPVAYQAASVGVVGAGMLLFTAALGFQSRYLLKMEYTALSGSKAWVMHTPTMWSSRAVKVPVHSTRLLLSDTGGYAKVQTPTGSYYVDISPMKQEAVNAFIADFTQLSGIRIKK